MAEHPRDASELSRRESERIDNQTKGANMTKTTTHTLNTGSEPGWAQLAEAHRAVTLEGIKARQKAAREDAEGHAPVEPGDPQARWESPEDVFRREAAYARAEHDPCG